MSGADRERVKALLRAGVTMFPRVGSGLTPELPVADLPVADLGVTADAVRAMKRRHPHDVSGLMRMVYSPHRKKAYTCRELLILGPVPYLLLLQERPELEAVLGSYALDLARLALHLAPDAPDLRAGVSLLERRAGMEERLVLAGRVKRRLRRDARLAEPEMYAACAVVAALRAGELDLAISCREAVICLLHGTDHHQELLPTLSALLRRYQQPGE